MTETIVAVAHRYHPEEWSKDPRAVATIITAPPPARHHNLFAGGHLGRHFDDGFITSTGRFVEREEALNVALASGQSMIDHPARHARLLFSEDLW